MNGQQENARLWPARGLGGVELLHARYRRQRFAPHVHEGYVFTVIERGAQRFRHRGAEHLAAAGSMVLINPDELHTGATAVEEGWQYRGFYPTLVQLGPVFAELGRPLDATPAFATSVLHDPQVSATFSQLHRLADGGAEPWSSRPPGARRCSCCSAAMPAWAPWRNRAANPWRCSAPVNCSASSCSNRPASKNWPRR